MIFTNSNDTNKKEDSMLSYYNYTPSKTFITYENNNNNFLTKNKNNLNNNNNNNNYYNNNNNSNNYKNK